MTNIVFTEGQVTPDAPYLCQINGHNVPPSLLIAVRDALRERTAEIERLRAQLAAADEFGDRHVIDLREDGWTIAHPLSCRAAGLFACPVNAAAEGLYVPPQVGRFEVTVESGRLVIGEPIEREAGLT